MSIRLIAKDLYRLQKQVEAIEKQLETTEPARRAELTQKLNKARAEKEHVRQMLDGHLDTGSKGPVG